MDRRTDGRYQVHYLPRFAVDKYVPVSVLFFRIAFKSTFDPDQSGPSAVRPVYANVFTILRGTSNTNQYRSKLCY